MSTAGTAGDGLAASVSPVQAGGNRSVHSDCRRPLPALLRAAGSAESRAALAMSEAFSAKPEVSVVIPTYNRKEATIRAVQSALDQTLPPAEIIVVDDHSSDPAPAAELLALDPRIRLITHTRNRGASAARNTGIDAASGNWIAFLDSDDLWFPHKLARQFREMESISEGEAFGCTNVLMQLGGDKNKPYNAQPPGTQHLSEYFLIDGCTFQTSSLLVPTALARRVRFDERLKIHEDWDFVLRLVRDGAKFSYLHEPLVVYDARSDALKLSYQDSVAPTLAWFDLAGDLVTNRARLTRYLAVWFHRHLRENPVGAVYTLVKYTLIFPRGIPMTLAYVWGFFKVRFARLLCRSRQP